MYWREIFINLLMQPQELQKVYQSKLVIENRIPKTDLTIIGGKPKVGKTRLSIGLARCLLMGEEFLDVKPAGLSKIILITDDQSDADLTDDASSGNL